MEQDKTDHSTPPVVEIQAEIEALWFHLLELPGNDAMAFLERLKVKGRVHNHVHLKSN